MKSLAAAPRLGQDVEQPSKHLPAQRHATGQSVGLVESRS